MCTRRSSAALDRLPVRRDEVGPLCVRCGHDLRDLGERHVESSEECHQTGGLELALAIPSVAVVLVDVGGGQNPEPVVQPQSLR